MKERIEAVRAALRAKYGPRHHRIVGHLGLNEQVYVYGPGPRDPAVRWRCLGDLFDAECHVGLVRP